MDSIKMDLVRCNEEARHRLADSLFETDGFGCINKKSADYVARTFPDILLDIVRYLTERATKAAREPQSDEPAAYIRDQLKPYLAFTLLLGKCPQITGLMYNYFEQSSFQPLPENLFQISNNDPSKSTATTSVTYLHPGFNDDLVKEILTSLFKYLTFNPKWFSSIWNWSELGRFITLHTNSDIKYLAACCLSIITKPTRIQHMSSMLDIIESDQKLIDLQIKHRHIFENTFKPCIETKQEKAKQYAQAVGYSDTGYSYCSESLTKIANILLLKRDVESNPEFRSEYKKATSKFVEVPTVFNTMSRIAYSISINKPCLLRGPCGSGKTAILDYIAAHTNRLNPPEYVKVQIGDQIDSKLLIGSYACTEIPGQFEWQPGPLTKAMAYGSWIVFEDINSAPSEMAQVIHSVIENGNLSCVSSCPIKLDRPHPDFRIFFTQRTTSSNRDDSENSIRLGFNFVERLCDIIDLVESNDDDFVNIITKKYKFNQLAKTIILLYRKAETMIRNISLNRTVRVISPRDLFKFCDRISRRDTNFASEKLASKDLDILFLDAIDCFLSSLPLDYFKDTAEQLGQILNISSSDVQRLLFHRMPEVKQKSDGIFIGRAHLEFKGPGSEAFQSKVNLAYTKQTSQLIEKIALCIKLNEPVLLVGETGVGKTSIVQHLANQTRSELIVVNLSQQSDSSDLLGDYKPVETRQIMDPLNQKFEELFKKTFDSESNQTFLKHTSDSFMTAQYNSNWKLYLRIVCKICTNAMDQPIDGAMKTNWIVLHDRALRLLKRMSSDVESFQLALSFSEGSLLRAVREGHWILLDEINLAEPEVLQCLLLILDSIHAGKLYMNEQSIDIHSNFRIFACMNPSTDIGKRDLDVGTRLRFTEFFVDEVTEKTDLRLIVESYVKTCLTIEQIESLVNFYLDVRARKSVLNDISGNSPVYSLRTLCRALVICSNNVCNNMEKSLYESLKIAFSQQLNELSIKHVTQIMESTVFKNRCANLSSVVISKPKDSHNYVDVQGFWIQTSSEPIQEDSKYILTKSVTKNLQSLSRIISLSQRRLPILIQGNTSVGKTSLIMYLAKLTGNKCYRINNHEHTDLQEYVGSYVFKENGKLVFVEGLLVRAMKRGYWIILDELNLAPTELLEALNRVLDDNRELILPELKSPVKAHSKFTIFATQNPPEEYSGRKLLSRAFRNRFIELHFDEIPGDELVIILEKRCELAPQHAKKIVAVMKELQLHRRESGCFNGKSGYMTMRDLFRWGERYTAFKRTFPDDEFFDWDLHLASQGLILLEGRVRTLEEANLVKETIEKVFKRKLDRDTIYNQKIDATKFSAQFKHIHFSDEFRKLFVQLTTAMTYNEPVLLCGLTGCGKTTACQLYAQLRDQDLVTYNCHLNTESSDFIGGVRPTRIQVENQDDDDKFGEVKREQSFPWIDGPLLSAMKSGSIFLMDEISLADDAVLERINSVLESTRTITLTEKNGEEIHANQSFRFVATMNPGGDYGKKELSPALRNRFTEIYCHNTTNLNQIRRIIEGCLAPSLLKPKIAPHLLNVAQKFLKEYYKDNASTISIRDIISWCEFMNKTTNVKQPKVLSVQESLINGASLVFFDQFGTCGHSAQNLGTSLDLDRKTRLKIVLRDIVEDKFGKEPVYVDLVPEYFDLGQNSIAAFMKFYLYAGPNPIDLKSIGRQFVFDTPVVKLNIMRIVRAMQLDRPILLEGDPGAGKTSAVSALAKLTGHNLVRINLSEQTDISDLFGSDLPDLIDQTDGQNNKNQPSFSWHDGPMLKAIKESDWILLDEMNLASQSVLEGLNACFDHRGELYIPELNKSFKVNRNSIRIFACQNPYSQGAARKGLPQSFLNRFTSIYVESHSEKDLIAIIENLYPMLNRSLIEKMVEFNNEVSKMFKFSGFEFNLRDLLHWCDLLTKQVKSREFIELDLFKPDKFVQFVYMDRIRSMDEKAIVADLFEKIFESSIYEPPYRDLKLGEHTLIIARSVLSRKVRPPSHLPDLCILKYQMPYIESLAMSIEHNKMPIIVGDTGVGKRSMIRILSGLTGNELNIVCANEEMDTIELLGSYEQKSVQRDINELVDEAKKYVTTMINSITQKSSANTWISLFNHIWITLYTTSSRDITLSKAELMEAYSFQLCQMKELIYKIQPMCSHENEEKCQELIEKISKLIEKSNIAKKSDSTGSGNFEWIDSVLIKSIKEGSWLMIQNANLMNPATLDRLNSLVESAGSLSLNEKGSDTNGDIEILKPHPDFRLILTMNPEHGELSRAMRNRGVEIYVQTRFYFEDFLMLLDQNGFEPEEMKACMTYCVMQTSYDFHKRVTTETPEEDGSLLAYFGLNYVSTLTHEVRRGQDIDTVLSDLLLTYYKQKGFVEECSDIETLKKFVVEKLTEYRKTYEVNLGDERYKWRHLRHDLVAMTGGDAITVMLDRDNRIFYEDFDIEPLLKPDEIIENMDIVNTCITVKIFLELATHGDFEHRKAFIRETFLRYPNMMTTVNNHVELLYKEYIPLMKSLLPRSDLAPISEMHIDSRNTPDIHYYLQSLDYLGTKNQEGHQNRWVLSLHRIMLRMIVELVEERSFAEASGNSSLFMISEKYRAGEITMEGLIRPNAHIATDLYDLLDGILRVVSSRCFSNEMVAKMLPKLFWINYFICKLKRCYSKGELISICNQIPMLWALTYQKVIIPMIEDCELADLVYKNKKFSHRITHICDSLETPAIKQGQVEKEFYRKVLNLYAATSKLCDITSREVDRFFTALVHKYISLATNSGIVDSHDYTLISSGLTWSSSSYMQTLYEIEDELLNVELYERAANQDMEVARSELDKRTSDGARKKFIDMKSSYELHEDRLKSEAYRSKCMSNNRKKNTLDQFAPIWQFKLVQAKLYKQVPNQLVESCEATTSVWLKSVLKNVQGIIMSPGYYSNVTKFLKNIDDKRNAARANNQSLDDGFRRDQLDMFTTYLADHLVEYIVVDHQIVGWTKLRTTTSDLPSLAPLMPEYSPIISLVGCYSLDKNHLKLNSYSRTNPQLGSIMMYLWRSYALIKLNNHTDSYNMRLATQLIHLRTRAGGDEELFESSHQCDTTDACSCVESYIKKRGKKFSKIIESIESKVNDKNDALMYHEAIKLIHFGLYNMIEYAPMFTIDPSIKSREKLEVYKSELAHIKLDLNFRNTLFYWKTGENLQLNEIDSEDATLYPLSTRALVERRVKLEKSIARLRKEYTNRPKTDDGSLYFELRKEIEVYITRYNNSIEALINDVNSYITSDAKSKHNRMTNLITKCRMTIRSLEKSISQIKVNYSLYSEITTGFVVGLGFMLQGMRCLYSRLEQKMQIARSYGFSNYSIGKFIRNISSVFSFNKFTTGNIESVHSKLRFYPILNQVCPQDKLSHIQSLLLKTVLIQLNHHIIITPSDVQKCFPIVKDISDLFHAAWLKRKQHIEEQKRLKEELYHYKTSTTTLGMEISFERKEFLDLCAHFPTYDHIYQTFITVPITSADKENLLTEEKVSNLNRSVDLSQCIDICRAHYKFIKEAGCNLLGQSEGNTDNLPKIDMAQLIELEAEVFYAITRHCLPALNDDIDSSSLECHLLQAKQLEKVFKKQDSTHDVGSLKSSIEILDEHIFDIYHNANAFEALRFRELLSKVEARVNSLRDAIKGFDNHIILTNITRLIVKINSFLITDPLMKFITGSHTLLDKVDEWNRLSIPKEDKMIVEADELVELIKSWRSIEFESWKSSLHRVKKKYIDSTLCDLWFKLYQAFNNPIVCVRDKIREADETFKFLGQNEEILYKGFVYFIKEFLEESTFGDYQIRLDLILSFALQIHFATIYKSARPNYNNKLLEDGEKDIDVDIKKLATYVYNIHRQYVGLFAAVKEELQSEESKLMKELKTEIRIVAWQGRNLWSIKNSFRNSHRKLNKVMNKYHELLKRRIPGQCPSKFVLSDFIMPSSSISMVEKLRSTLSNIQLLVDKIKVGSDTELPTEKVLVALVKSPQITSIMRSLYCELSASFSKKYIGNLTLIEEALTFHAEAIQNFYSHNIEEVKLLPKDSIEIKEAKYKQCRQMYHSKTFSLQSIFKNLYELGVSYQRGLNSRLKLDNQIISLEPLRGMIQNQSQQVLKSTSIMINDDIISACNELYLKLVANKLFLFSRERPSDGITRDQVDRFRGFSLDLGIDVIGHLHVAAEVYRYLMYIQAATTRLDHLKERNEQTLIAKTTKTSILHNFNRIHSIVQQFNELVGRTLLAIAKLEELSKCHHKAIISNDNNSELDNQTTNIEQSGTDEVEVLTQEDTLIREMITEIDEKNSLMTQVQLGRFKSQLDKTQNVIREVSYQLKDMLNHTKRNYVYCDDDLENLNQLFKKFDLSVRMLLPSTSSDCPNLKSGTILGSLKSLLKEANLSLKPKLSFKSSQESTGTARVNYRNLNQHPNLAKLNLRIRKLIKQIKLASQDIYKSESDKDKSNGIVSEDTKRKMKPFNHLNSANIRNLLRLKQISEYTGDCFMTINLSEESYDIEPIIKSLTPILFIYSQEVASFLNIILCSVHLKLIAANQLISFFSDLLVRGFGLPYKLSDEDMKAEGQQAKASDDNTGFGDGQGETDASKKLEFESQLDDLKQNENDEKKDDEQDKIEAHDDGVEMTDDIDAKAQGPDEAPQTKDENIDQNGDNQSELDELDKELDKVDHDEGQLDEKIWNDDEDNDNGDEDDDKSDLRETKLDDKSIQPDKEETSLQAKDDQLTERKADDDSKEPQQLEAKEGDVAVEQENIKDDKQSDEEEFSTPKSTHGDFEEENKLELDDEANLATKEAQNNFEKSEQEPIEDIDMSIEMDENEDGLEQIGDDESIQLDTDEAKDDEINEVEKKDEDDNLTSENIIDEDELHNQLEQGVTMNQPLIDEQLPDPIKESLSRSASSRLPDINQQQDATAGLQDKSHSATRSSQVYNIYSEEDLDEHHLEYDELEQIQETQDTNQQQAPNDDISSFQGDFAGHEDIDINLNEAKPEDQINGNQDEKHAKTDDEKGTKRSVNIEKDDQDRENIKRQRITKNAGDEEKTEQKEDGDELPKNKAEGPVKHSGADTEKTHEVIDILSSDDDETNVLRSELKNTADDYEDIDKQQQELNASLMEQIDNELKKKSNQPDVNNEHISLDTDRLTNLWIECTRSTGHLVYELCQQLQIVLQPTKMAKYKGDYKSGKRLNMRKIISYIASMYMKDKIWLRRTKPSKRTYNIMIAVDNSSSMHENNCRQMTYQSLALLAKSLSLIEAGSLSVVKFGEQFKCIHEFGQPYMDAIGAQWLSELQFTDTRTSYFKLLKNSCESFERQSKTSRDTSATLNQLLIIISDGRNVSSEEDELKNYLKSLREMNVLTLFLIIDDLKRNNNCSIVDVKRTVRSEASLEIVSYMELFPFPFYVLLRNLDSMPSVLGDALRQWFELVSSYN